MPTAPSSIDLSFLRSREALKRVALWTAACVAAAVLYVLFAPSWYRSVLTLVPSKPPGKGVSGLLSPELAGIAAGLEPSLGGGTADIERVSAVLQSIGVSDAVIDKFGLRKRYGNKYQEYARKELWEHCFVRTLPKPSLVQLSCEDKDPRFVQQLLAYFAEYGNQVFRRVSVGSATEEVRFLEKRVVELRQQADEAAARMQEFQEKYQIVDIDTQAKAVVSAMAALNSQRITKELELDYARTFASRDEATAQQLQSQLSIVDDKLRDLEAPAPNQSEKRVRHRREAATGLFPAALAVPKLRAEFEKQYRDRRVAETSLVFVLQSLEAAKANEARDTSTFLVLDPPALPTRPSRPRRSATVVAAALLGLLGSVAWEWWRQRGRALESNSSGVRS